MTKTNEATGWYANVFKGWDNKVLGRRPTAAELHTIHALGARPGKQALASAMALRECGVTRGQVDIACGAPQFNKMRAFRASGVLKREATPPNDLGHTIYKMVLTTKGESAVKKADEAATTAAADTGDKPAKPAKAVSAKSAKKAERKAAAKAAAEAKAAETPVTTEAPVTEVQPQG